MEHVGADRALLLERRDGVELPLEHLPQFGRDVERAPLVVLRRAGVQPHDACLEVHAVDVSGSTSDLSRQLWMPGGSMGYLAAAIELTWIVLVLESSVPTTATFFPANSLDLSWSLNR